MSEIVWGAWSAVLGTRWHISHNDGSNFIGGAPADTSEADIEKTLQRLAGDTEIIVERRGYAEPYIVEFGDDLTPAEQSVPLDEVRPFELRIVSPTGRVLIPGPIIAYSAKEALQLVTSVLDLAQERLGSPPDPLAPRVTPGTDAWYTHLTFTDQGELVGK